jgi:DNA-binding Xre family transcriptional regulator
MKTYTFEQIQDEMIGPIGTPERDRYEQELNEELHACRVGEAIKQVRISKNLTQEQLGEKIGVQKSQISRLERGKSVTLTTLSRVCKALDIQTSLDIAGIGKVALW